MTTTAYALLILDAATTPAVPIGAWIFNEADPMLPGRKLKCFTLFTVDGCDYIDAAGKAARLLATGQHDWIGELRISRAMGAYRELSARAR